MPTIRTLFATAAIAVAAQDIQASHANTAAAAPETHAELRQTCDRLGDSLFAWAATDDGRIFGLLCPERDTKRPARTSCDDFMRFAADHEQERRQTESPRMDRETQNLQNVMIRINAKPERFGCRLTS